MELILKKIELKRISFLKRIYSCRSNFFFRSSPRSQNFAAIHDINEAFVQGGSIKINQKAMVNFNEDQKKKGIKRTLTSHLKLKKNFFNKIEKSPDEIKKYFRAKLKGNRNFFKKVLEEALKKIRTCIKKRILISN